MHMNIRGIPSSPLTVPLATNPELSTPPHFTLMINPDVAPPSYAPS